MIWEGPTERECKYSVSLTYLECECLCPLWIELCSPEIHKLNPSYLIMSPYLQIGSLKR